MSFGPLIALLVLFSLPIIESRSSRGSSYHATKNKSQLQSHREETWMDMMQATQSQQCHTLQPEDRSTQDKLVLAPIVFQGKIMKVT